MNVVLVLTILMIVIYSIERMYGIRMRNRIPVRIHVNGTRGKSSVTRLIAGGLRGGGKRVCAKTTGSAPRFILPNGQEIPIFRPGKANIKEQVKVFARAVEANAEMLVVECMALQPDIQSLSQDAMVNAQVSVITNIRADHLDVMGPTVADVGRNLARTTPHNGHVFTAEKDPQLTAILDRTAVKRGSKVIITDITIPDEWMNRFSYVEHKENVSLALSVCRHFGIADEQAIDGMVKTDPDVGALRIYRMFAFNKTVHFVNAMAANDPDSTVMIWNMICKRLAGVDKRIVLVNSRDDRIDRAKQMGEMLAKSMPDAHYYVIVGGLTELVERSAIAHGADARQVINMGDSPVTAVLDQVLEWTDKQSLVFACGNIGGMGWEVLHHFAGRSQDQGAAA